MKNNIKRLLLMMIGVFMLNSLALSQDYSNLLLIIGTKIHDNYELVEDYQGVIIIDNKSNVIESVSYGEASVSKYNVEKGAYYLKANKNRFQLDIDSVITSHEIDTHDIYDRPLARKEKVLVNSEEKVEYLKNNHYISITKPENYYLVTFSPLMYGFGGIGSSNSISINCLGNTILNALTTGNNITLSFETIDNNLIYKVEILNKNKDVKFVLWVDSEKDYRIIREEQGTYIENDHGSLFIIDKEIINDIEFDKEQEAWLPNKATIKEYYYPQLPIIRQKPEDFISGKQVVSKLLKKEANLSFQKIVINRGIDETEFSSIENEYKKGDILDNKITNEKRIVE